MKIYQSLKSYVNVKKHVEVLISSLTKENIPEDKINYYNSKETAKIFKNSTEIYINNISKLLEKYKKVYKKFANDSLLCDCISKANDMELGKKLFSDKMQKKIKKTEIYKKLKKEYKNADQHLKELRKYKKDQKNKFDKFIGKRTKKCAFNNKKKFKMNGKPFYVINGALNFAAESVVGKNLINGGMKKLPYIFGEKIDELYNELMVFVIKKCKEKHITNPSKEWYLKNVFKFVKKEIDAKNVYDTHAERKLKIEDLHYYYGKQVKISNKEKNLVSLNKLVKNNVGVCRHYSMLTAILLGCLINDGHAPKSMEVRMFRHKTNRGNGKHGNHAVVVVYDNKTEDAWFIDSYNNRFCKINCDLDEYDEYDDDSEEVEKCKENVENLKDKWGEEFVKDIFRRFILQTKNDDDLENKNSIWKLVESEQYDYSSSSSSSSSYSY